MRKSSVAAFLATVLVAVPAGWHLLGASIQTDGPGVRPPTQTFQTEGVTVRLELDRGIATPGSKVTARLVATSEVPKEISLDVRALEDMGYGSERVANPPQLVGKRRVKVTSAPGGGPPVEVAFELGSRRKGSAQWFDIVVMSTKTKFRIDDDVEPTVGAARYWGDETTPATAARAGFAVWGGNEIPISFDPTSVPATGPFEIAVRVKNTKKKPIDWVSVDVGNQIGIEGLSSELMVSAYGDESPYDVEPVETEVPMEAIAPGAERVFRFKITPRNDTTRTFTIAAHVQGDRTGAVEVTSFQRPAPGEAPAIVGMAPVAKQ